MNENSGKRGSALLIVLGMIAFMIVSALGFAAYMRYSRLPSSYLRRNTAARQLVKAGLARAIDDIDMAINLNPHPGIGVNNSAAGVYNNPPGNYWKDRVFMGYATNMNIDATQEGGGGMWSQTVPVLTLEGLAYIPPVLVNSARVYSRLTASATWHNLDYDAGRYAYVALDVSDYFDVNRMVTGRARSSAANRRVGFSYMFEDMKHETLDDQAAQAFNDFLDRFREPLGGAGSTSVAYDYRSKTPLVSVADLNLALWRAGKNQGVGGRIRSPFCAYLQGDTGYAGFYGISGRGTDFNTMYEMMTMQTFVTDGYYPKPLYRKINKDEIAGVEAGQYYEKAELAEIKNILPTVRKGSEILSIINAPLTGDAGEELYNKLSGLGELCLADYLDYDQIPISLALPTWERQPMIAAMQPQVMASMKCSFLDRNGQQMFTVVEEQEGKADSRVVESRVQFDFNLDIGALSTIVAYPFARHTNEELNQMRGKSYTLEGRLSCFFTSGQEPTLRTTASYNPNQAQATADPLHLSGEDPFGTKIEPAKGLFSYNGKYEFNFSESPAEETEAAKMVPLVFRQSAAQQVQNNSMLLRVTYRWQQTRNPLSGQWEPSFTQAIQNRGNITNVECPFVPLDVKLGYVPNTTQFSPGKVRELFSSDGSIPITMSVGVWVKITEPDGLKVVDLVPACILDDQLVNGTNRDSGQLASLLARWFSGPNYPIMRFDTPFKFDFGFDWVVSRIAAAASTLTENQKDVKITLDATTSPSAVVCVDPRFNFAPEHWLALDNVTPGNLRVEDWLTAVEAVRDGDAKRDQDIFLASSNQGYLQSPYEIAVLPRFTNLYTFNNSGNNDANGAIVGGYKAPGNVGLKTFPKTFNEVENQEFMWRSYDPFGVDREAFADLGITARGHGIKVNPFSDSTNILMAAFANAPSGWRFASTNNQTVALEELPPQEFNLKYAVNAYGGGGTEADAAGSHLYLKWETLTKIAARFSEEVRRNGGDWERAFDGLGWMEDYDSIAGVPLAEDEAQLWGVDRKFLYGFWRDCFSADQQLFLIFVRAEPSMMGGEISGQVPPNLGARAVALVWRDPRECFQQPVGDYGIPGYPHRTRIIFYHSLD